MIFGPPILRPGIFRHAFGVGRIASPRVNVAPATHDYLGQLVAAGVNTANPVPGTAITWAQVTAAIDAFIVAETFAGRWADHRRIYLPIWGLAAPNAICMKTCTSGTFVNSPTHGAGFVQGNGSTSYFDAGVSPTAAGFSATSGSMFAVVYQNDSRSDARMMLGARNNSDPATGECSLYQGSASVVQAIIGRAPAIPVVALTVAARTGVFHSNRNSAQGLLLSQRRASVTRTTAATSTAAISTLNFSVMAITDGAIRNLHTNARLGAYGFGLGLANNAAVDAFTANLKTLWESCTGLTLP